MGYQKGTDKMGHHPAEMRISQLPSLSESSMLADLEKAVSVLVKRVRISSAF